jgi:hypothetical protein
MLGRHIPFSIAALLITVIGAFATLAIIRTSTETDADAYVYGSVLPQQKSGEVPTIGEELKR